MTDDEQIEEKSVVDPDTELRLLQEILVALRHLNGNSRKKLVRTILAYFEMSPSDLVGPGFYNSFVGHSNQAMSPKEFIQSKQPINDTERVACLAYYLKHYLHTSQFKSADITRVNREAGQRKFVSTTKAIGGALKQGYLNSSATGKGVRELSDTGELLVTALPDRQKASRELSTVKPDSKIKSTKRN